MSATRHRESSRLKQLREGLGSGWLLWQSEARASASIEVMIAVVVVDMVDSRLGLWLWCVLVVVGSTCASSLFHGGASHRAVYSS